ncbi:unnamed protein product [Phytophthora fragariaefolia]|uniref:Unnamed protein product n=1 Tax=Phytophthora fragariaefolia TaxID=1490495 RepID=A0A9W6WV72_9STRA|nr:unnamed protein product [Phytophthora fragariaefolia]
MVKPVGKVVFDFEVTARDLSFKSVWRELKRDGWSRKPPPRRSLDERYFYIRPDGSPAGTGGVNYFRGEQAVLVYYANGMDVLCVLVCFTANLLFSARNTQLATAHDVVRLNNAADTEEAAAQAQSASVSTAQAASPPATAIGDAPSIAGPFQPAAPVQAASTTAQDIAVLPAQAPPFSPSTCARELITTSPHIEDKDDDDAASIDHREGSSDVADDDEAEEEEVTARGNELLADNDDDLNAVDNSSNTNFGAVESGDEAEKDDVEIGEYDSSGGTEHEGALDDIGDDQKETETEIAAEVLFAEKVLDTFGGEDEVLAENLKNAALRSIAASGWEAVEAPDIHERLMAPYEPVNDAGSYPGLRQGYSGPTAEVLRHGDSPVTLSFS